MKGKRFVFAFALALVFGSLGSLSLAAQGLLPFSLGNWASSSTATQVSAQQIEQFANERANILREYGITSGERREYTSGSDKISVTLYRMIDPSAAFGAFTFLRDPDMALPGPVTAASFAAGKRGHALLVVGNLVMGVDLGGRRIIKKKMNALAQSVARQADRRP